MVTMRLRRARKGAKLVALVERGGHYVGAKEEKGGEKARKKTFGSLYLKRFSVFICISIQMDGSYIRLGTCPRRVSLPTSSPRFFGRSDVNVVSQYDILVVSLTIFIVL